MALAAGKGYAPSYTGPGTQPLTVFPQLASGGLLTNSTVINDIRTGQPGTLAQLYQMNGLNGNINFFPNPNGLGMNSITNGSNSTTIHSNWTFAAGAVTTSSGNSTTCSRKC